ncbi:hypothetical protein [Corynebacterium bouchesdurhonense]|uniref:hypothetical protein n=1 Tax=Corynebacterium bouchesdurhonense TaxID=1720192 RepID=UPI000831906B|nr:hypothetical protein [Corynebacterium bouchesdurhonense]
MKWQGQVLRGAPVPTAYLPESRTLAVGAEELRVVSDDATDARAVTPDGQAFRLIKRSTTVARYEAVCGGRRYSARRTGGGFRSKRREITDERGRLVAATRGLPNGDLELEISGGSANFTVDLAFISWGLLLVDAPVRRTLH